MTSSQVDAAGFRHLILARFPELASRLLDAPINCHKDAELLNQFARTAIVSENLESVVRVFRFASELVSVRNKLEFYTENAVWTVFLRGYMDLAEPGLRLFKQIDQTCRRELYCPFVIPRSWFEAPPFGLPPSGEKVMIDHEAISQARYVTQNSSFDHFADVTLQLLPVAESEEVKFEDVVPPLRELSYEFIEQVHAELGRQLLALSGQGKRLQGLVIRLIDAIEHDVDTRATDIHRVTAEAFQKCLRDAGLKRLS